MMPTQPQARREPSLLPTLAVASGNAGKIAEFHTLLGEGVEIMSLRDLGLLSPEETGTTFEENALLKARYVFDQVGMVTLADDSGLEVDALDGAPGVLSARYAGDQHDDAANRVRLLDALDNVADESRTARFVAVIAIIDLEGEVTLARGTCEGLITRQERGLGGFGYDSLFELPDGRTMAELSAATKNTVSHRAQAMRIAMPVLRAALGLSPDQEDSESP